jgi:trans-AT polyketide synthase/acyltransferase/oxidoreductase domain-containing protein
MITAKTLGCRIYRQRHQILYAYAAGGMYHAIASKELVAAMVKSGCMSFFGAGGLPIEKIEEAILFLKRTVRGDNYGINILFNHIVSAKEASIIDLALKHGIKNVEAASFPDVTPELVLYRIKGLKKLPGGGIISDNNVMAKVSRIEIAKKFMSPAPGYLINRLLEEGRITKEESLWAKQIPVANEICVEAESAGHTDRRAACIILPAILRAREEIILKNDYNDKICIGLAGGIGTPKAASAAFIMGADFILTGSINQCTKEAGVHPVVKELLSKMNSEDTDFTPSGDMLESDAKIQVLKKGLLFPARSKKLHEIYHRYNSIDDLSIKDRLFLEKKIFCNKKLEDVFEQSKEYFPAELVKKADESPKVKMGLIFKVYFYQSIKSTYSGNVLEKLNFQIYIGSAMGAFNEYVRGSGLEDHKKRSAPVIARKIMADAAVEIEKFYSKFLSEESLLSSSEPEDQHI